MLVSEAFPSIEAVLAVGLDGRLIYVNRCFEMLTGQARGELLGAPLSSMFLQDRDSQGEGVCSISRQAMEQSCRLGPAIDWLRGCHDTCVAVAECYAAPIRDRYGLTSGVIIVLRGIEERRMSQPWPAANRST